MKRPRWRFSIRVLMLAVALSPIVLYAGLQAGIHWGTTTTIVPPPTSSVTSVAEDGTMTIEVVETGELSIVAALIVMVATSIALFLVCKLIGQVFRFARGGPGSPPEDDRRVDVGDPAK